MDRIINNGGSSRIPILEYEMESDSDYSEYESDGGRVFVYAPGLGLLVKQASPVVCQGQVQGSSSKSGNFNRERSPCYWESIGPSCDITDEAFRAERRMGDWHTCVYNERPGDEEYDPTESDFVCRALSGPVNDFMEVVDRSTELSGVVCPPSCEGLPIGKRVLKVWTDESGPDVVVASSCRYTNTYKVHAALGLKRVIFRELRYLWNDGTVSFLEETYWWLKKC
ncbi:hypothetical protein HDU98_009902 [Podochytrium sp. JEL0797]|nr:hypothetical protein HDU98_009902 [Podochytrium sp. JEL0797]